MSDRVGGYVLGQRLAVGGMAELFAAEPVQRSFNKPIVLKRMLPHLASDSRFVEMFVDEARISSRLEHPNIVQVLDFEATAQGLCLVMELVDGPDLLTIIRRAMKLKVQIPRELAVYIACHVLEALDYAHTAAANGRPLKIVHRDVSPSNILLTRRGQVKLADFGIARAAERQQESASGTLKGKYGYMSPEQVEGRELDARSDVFSLAIVLAETLMSRRLFTAPNDLETLLMVRRGDISRWDEYSRDVPVELDAIVRKALVVDRDKRFTSAAEFRDALADWLTSSPKRTGAPNLAKFLELLEAKTGNLCAWSTPTRATGGSLPTLSGTNTRMARLEQDELAELGRWQFQNAPITRVDAHGNSRVVVPSVKGALHTQIAPRQVLEAVTESYPQTIEVLRGTLDNVSLPELLAEILKGNLTGCLTLRSGDELKEAYFVDGNPEYVSSNVPEDRLGEFLLRRGIISESILKRALHVMPQFGGRFAETLVQIGILKPVDAMRALTAQVQAKLVRACKWDRASYEFAPNVRNPNPMLALGIRTSDILGQTLAVIPRGHAIAWARANAKARPVVDTTRVTEFHLGGIASTLFSKLRGEVALGDFLDQAQKRAPDIGVAAYGLWRTGVLVLRESFEEEAQLAQVAAGQRHLPPTQKRRASPRVRLQIPAELTFGTVRCQAQIHTASAEGLGLYLPAEPFAAVPRRGDTATIGFVASHHIEIRANVAWVRERADAGLDLGLRLRLETLPTAAREAYARWVVQVIRLGGDSPDGR